MAFKFLGWIVLIASAAMMVIAIQSLREASEDSQVMSLAMNAARQPFDAVDWERRWRASSLRMIGSSAVLACAGIGLILRRRWILGLAAVGLTAGLGSSLYAKLRGGPKYRFEGSSIGELVIGVILVAVLWWRYAKMRHRAPLASGAPYPRRPADGRYARR